MRCNCSKTTIWAARAAGGYGQVTLNDITVSARRDYSKPVADVRTYASLNKWTADLNQLEADLFARFGLTA